jgi:hypothetical protein
MKENIYTQSLWDECMNHGPRWVLLMKKKNRGGKSRATVPLTTKYSKSFQRSFVIGSIIVFSFGGIRNSIYMNLHIWNSVVLKSKNFA